MIATAAQPSMRRRYLTGLAMILTTMVAFSSITTLARLAYDGGTNPPTVVWLRIVGFLVLIGTLQMVRGRSLQLSRHLVGTTLWMSLCLLVMSVGYLASVAFISVGIAVVFMFTFPLMVGVMAHLSGRERIGWVKAICLIGAFGGIAIVAGPKLDQLDIRGIALALSAALGIALSITFAGKQLAKADPTTMNFWTNLWMFVMMSAGLLLTDSFALPGTATSWLAALGIVLCYTLALALMFIAMTRLPPAEIALALNLEPALSTIWAVTILGETVGIWQWSGIALMLACLSIASIAGARR